MRTKSLAMELVPLFLLLLIGGLSCRLCRAALEEADEDEQLLSEGLGDPSKTLNLFGPELDEEADLQLHDLDELAKMVVNKSPDAVTEVNEVSEKAEPVMLAHPETEAQPTVWKEPHNEMSLVRFFNGRYYQCQYPRINDYLIRVESSTNVEPNMEKVYELLDRQKKRGVNVFVNRALVEALEQLAELGRLEGADYCTRHSYAALFKNDRATKGRAHKSPSRLDPLRRVDAVVYQLFAKHAIECFHQYPEAYKRIRESQLDVETRSIESFIDSLVGDAHAIESKVRHVKGKQAAALAYSFIRMRGANDPQLRYLDLVVDERRGKMWVDSQQVGALVTKYLVAPCETYVSTMGPDVFLLARFDAQMLEKEDRYAAESELMAQFMHGWIHYRLCELLVKRDQASLTKSLVSYVYKVAKHTS